MEAGETREVKDLDGDGEPVETGTPPGSDPEVPSALLAEWRTAEDRLYPMVMVIPESYERVVRLVGATTVELQLACGDVGSLVAAAPDVAERVRRLASESGTTDRLDLPLIAAAACLMRYRQLEADTRRDQRRRRIADARESGATWVTLEHGAPPSSWPPMPSATVEMHLASGRSLEEMTTIDSSSGAAHFVLAEMVLDAETGELNSRREAQEEFDDLHRWRAAIAARRQMIEGSH
jgi:hypothetical protein